MDLNNFDDIEEREPFKGCKGKFIHSERMTLVLWDIKKDSPLPEHSHPHEQITYLIEGSYEFVVDGEAKVLVPGDVLVIPSSKVHSGKPLTDCKILDVFSPVREDYK